jgi:type I restriction enzyme M protein
MYLHSFADPSIYEYDTLTSEDRWDERYDVIMTNPPFMSPKGGIRPHSRFTIKAKRSEVLFVDYIAEHLNVHGRAGVIVPEGIIFQSQNAYKNLRRMLIDEGYLYAVISMPAGVFQPYSGVKTSILLMDKTLAKKTGKILFVKVANDGFDLGAQRRSIDKNDLPQALKIVKAWKQAIVEGKGFEIDEDGIAIAHTVTKEKIAESGDYNLSGDRYKEVISYANVKWPMVELGKVCEEIKNGKNVKQIDEKGRYRVTRIQTISNWNMDLTKTKWTNDEIDEKDFLRDGDILLSHINSMEHLAKSAIFTGISEKVVHGINLIKIRPDKKSIHPNYLHYIFLSSAFIEQARNLAQRAVNQASIKVSDIKCIPIPFPPLEVQEKIVAELDGYQKIIDGAKQVVENYKLAIKIDPDWPMVELNSICDVRDGTHDSPKYQKTGFPLVTSKNVREGKIDFTTVNLISKEDLDNINKRSRVDDGDIIMPMIGTIGNPIIVMKDREFAIKNVALIKFHKNSRINRIYLKSILESNLFSSHYLNRSNGSTQKFISLKFIRGLQIPLPPLETQEKIIAEIESERELVEANKKLIEIFEKKIKDKIGEVWGE